MGRQPNAVFMTFSTCIWKANHYSEGMTKSPATTPLPPALPPWWSTAWPRTAAGEEESLRRRKLAVRAGHLAMVFMVLVAASVAPLSKPGAYTSAQVLGLLLASLAYIFWNLIGTTGVVTLVLWDKPEAPPLQQRAPRCGSMIFFTVQVILAAAVYWWSDRGVLPNLNWLALLPPVAYAVFMLEWPGIGLHAALMLGILVAAFGRWHPWSQAFSAALAFSFAIFFTIVFSLLAVQSEKARSEVMRLAARISVLRNGRLVETLARRETSPDALLRLMAPAAAKELAHAG